MSLCLLKRREDAMILQLWSHVAEGKKIYEDRCIFKENGG